MIYLNIQTCVLKKKKLNELPFRFDILRWSYGLFFAIAKYLMSKVLKAM